MIIYSVSAPIFEDSPEVPETVCEFISGIVSFYEKQSDGSRALKFSTDPKMYLERGKPLH